MQQPKDGHQQGWSIGHMQRVTKSRFTIWTSSLSNTLHLLCFIIVPL